MICYELKEEIIKEYELTTDILEARAALESVLKDFAVYVNPTYAYGEIHFEVFDWLQYGTSPYQLLLMPRDHLKSHCIAVWTAWQITREPWSSIVYLSAGEDLAKNQMYAIKNMLYSDEYKLLWPEMIAEAKSKRDKDTDYALNVDHPERKRRRIRDNTLIIKTVKSNAIGLHCSHLVLDDVVVPKFAYNANGRLEVQQSVAQFASIKSPDAITKAVGTRYHPEDLYQNFRDAKIPVLNADGEMVTEAALWDIKEYQLESRGDGTGRYLWPRTYSTEIKTWFGFDINVRARKKAEYDSLGQEVQFLAQYYNKPNDPSLDRVSIDRFQYYDEKHLIEMDGKWYYKDRILNIYAGMDVAFTDLKSSGGKRADFTAIVVLGLDYENNCFILALDRFKTDDFDVYYKHVTHLHNHWGFRKLKIESNAGGKVVAKGISKACREEGMFLVIDPSPSTRNDAAKYERHAAVVEPAYNSGRVWHRKGGLTPILEEEVRLLNPATDDLEDAFYLALIDAVAPTKQAQRKLTNQQTTLPPVSRFGGRRSSRGN